MKKTIFLVIFIIFSTQNLYAEKISSPATVDEINQYLPATFKNQLNKGEMLLKYFGDEVLLLSREDVIKYITITKYNYNYKQNGKEKTGFYYRVLFKNGNSSMSYPIGDYISFVPGGKDGYTYWKANYFGCYMTPISRYNGKGELINTYNKEPEGICKENKFNQ